MPEWHTISSPVTAWERAERFTLKGPLGFISQKTWQHCWKLQFQHQLEVIILYFCIRVIWHVGVWLSPQSLPKKGIKMSESKFRTYFIQQHLDMSMCCTSQLLTVGTFLSSCLLSGSLCLHLISVLTDSHFIYCLVYKMSKPKVVRRVQSLKTLHLNDK